MTDNQRYINELKKRITQLEFLCDLQAKEIKNLKRELKEQAVFNALDDWFSQENNKENDDE